MDVHNSATSAWVFHGEGSAQQSFAERARDWFRLAHLNFQRIYPWILLAPYVALLASYFPLERGWLRLNLPLHLAACAAFAAAAYTINAKTTTTVARVLIVTSHRSADFPPGFETNFLRIEDSATSTRQEFREEVTQRLSTRSLAGQATSNHPGLKLNGAAEVGPTDYLLKREHGAKPPVPPPGLPTMRPLTTLLDLLAYCALVGLAHSVHFYGRYRERERRALFLESNLVKAKLSALQAQLQPHFLFNSLNAIVTLLRRDPRLAEITLTSLSELLRLTLSRSEKQEVPLRDELEFVTLYVEIQQTRFGDHLRFERDVEASALDYLVPTLLLQPLFENAIRHGIEPSEDAGMVRLTAWVQNQRLRLTVEDDGVGFPGVGRGMPAEAGKDPVFRTQPTQADLIKSGFALGAIDQGSARNGKSGTGIGLSNLRARLEALYGVDQKLEFVARSGGGVEVRVEIPLRQTPSVAPASARDLV